VNIEKKMFLGVIVCSNL